MRITLKHGLAFCSKIRIEIPTKGVLLLFARKLRCDPEAEAEFMDTIVFSWALRCYVLVICRIAL